MAFIVLSWDVINLSIQYSGFVSFGRKLQYWTDKYGLHNLC